MSHQKWYFAAILGFLSLYGCSDDSSGSSSGGGDTPQTPNSCTDNSECKSGICLDQGVCVVEVGEGASCNEEKHCKSGLKCLDGTCKAKSDDPTEDCASHDDCPKGQVCDDTRCVQGECATSEDCDDEKVCMNHACVVDDPSCQSDEDCAANTANPMATAGGR